MVFPVEPDTKAYENYLHRVEATKRQQHRFERKTNIDEARTAEKNKDKTDLILVGLVPLQVHN